MSHEETFATLLEDIEAALQKSLVRYNEAVRQGVFERAEIEIDRQKDLVNARHQLQGLQELWPELIGKEIFQKTEVENDYKAEEAVEHPPPGISPEDRPIFVNYKRKRYTAVLLPNLQIRFQRKVYSPSGAAMAITGNNVNGWKFWRYLDAQGQEQPIDVLRRGIES